MEATATPAGHFVHLRRQCAGTYQTRDGEWTIVQNPAGWVAYRTHEPLAADRYDTLWEARQALEPYYA